MKLIYYSSYLIVLSLISSLNGMSQTELTSDLSLWSENTNQTKNPQIKMTNSENARNAMMMAADFDLGIVPRRPFYNHSFKFSTGYSLNTLRLDNSMRDYNDTSEHAFSVIGHSPLFSLSYSHAIDSTFTLGYTFAYANSEIYFDNKPYGSQFFYFSFNPQLHIIRNYHFEYYIKLKVGFEYDQNNLCEVPSQRIQNQYPTGFHMFTGFTFAGINYLISDNLALNAEFSIWSPETANVGLSYRFSKKCKKTTEADFYFSF